MDIEKASGNNFFTAAPLDNAQGNFFAAFGNVQNSIGQKKQSPHRLNDYDSNILENTAYQKISDDMLKIEHRIGILEDTLTKITAEIEALKSFGDSIQINSLIDKKQLIEEEIEELNRRYSELGLSAKISGQIASVIRLSSKNKAGIFSKIKNFVSKNILARFFKKINYRENIKDALVKLSSINSNVDDLITMHTPYGETFSRYEKLTAYINKANSIHAQISKNLKEIK
ncbi:MAG TPA: hypothetical protein PLG15_05035 [Candidatus Gastranaerophilaceae bacterium]|nr:hypothetical protein [Candidatus Gastranaerophilaceae bacterium]HPT41728.1 hypothetical protein [Candidatus Gastranaerophilaceae bacterium]